MCHVQAWQHTQTHTPFVGRVSLLSFCSFWFELMGEDPTLLFSKEEIQSYQQLNVAEMQHTRELNMYILYILYNYLDEYISVCAWKGNVFSSVTVYKRSNQTVDFAVPAVEQAHSRMCKWLLVCPSLFEVVAVCIAIDGNIWCETCPTTCGIVDSRKQSSLETYKELVDHVHCRNFPLEPVNIRYQVIVTDVVDWIQYLILPINKQV